MAEKRSRSRKHKYFQLQFGGQFFGITIEGWIAKVENGQAYIKTLNNGMTFVRPLELLLYPKSVEFHNANIIKKRRAKIIE